MPDVTQGLRLGGPSPHQRQLVTGIVSPNRPAPSHYDDPLFVVLPSFSSDISFQCEHWPKIHGSTFPAPGAETLICFDDAHTPHCIWWDGLYTP